MHIVIIVRYYNDNINIIYKTSYKWRALFVIVDNNIL